MSKLKKPLKPIIPAKPGAKPEAKPAQATLTAQQLALLAQLAQEGLAAQLAKGVPLTQLGAHAQALHDVQAALGIGMQQQTQPAAQPAAAAAADAKPEAKAEG